MQITGRALSTWCICNFCLLLTAIGFAYFAMQALEMSTVDLWPIELMEQDWETRPFVNIAVRPYCYDVEEPVFFKNWHGTKTGYVHYNAWGQDWVDSEISSYQAPGRAL